MLYVMRSTNVTHKNLLVRYKCKPDFEENSNVSRFQLTTNNNVNITNIFQPYIIKFFRLAYPTNDT